MNQTRTKLFFFFGLLALSVPATLALAEFLTGFTTVETFLAAWSPGVWAWWIGSSLVAGLVLGQLYQRLETSPEKSRVTVLVVFLLIWGPLHHLGFAYWFHAGSSYAADAAGQYVGLLYNGAVGLYLAILGVIAIIGDLEVSVPFRNASGQRQLAGKLNTKLLMSVSLAILAFLVGAIGVSLMPVHAGLGIVDSLSRALLVSIPFLLLTLVLVNFLSSILTSPLVKASPMLEALGKDDLRSILPETSRDELGLVFHNLNRFLGRLRVTVAEARTLARKNGDRSTALDTLVESQNDLLNRVLAQVKALEGRLERLVLQVLRFR